MSKFKFPDITRKSVTASRWQMLRVVLFGARYEEMGEDNCHTIAYWHKGCLYVVKHERKNYDI